ncbi:chemotaxis protein CheW [Taurinivorans muris]|jgi:Chemotaxis signal transduction protein|uniref:Chemotaxis protein CheW n=1 Tax=Taurinivorans muris TaxID=2787751 RepID=A0ABY5Y0D6_9BACT|nr:chemotaxis protein CheW [Mailhella sp.]UWX05001.1 chemotaxis protein CheW [Desulfovibrionaceae bacterium LT0009]
MSQTQEINSNNKEPDNKILQLVSFKLGEEEFAVDILIVNDIIRLVPITPVPHAPHFIEGVINLRGRILPVVSFRKRFHMPEVEQTNQTRIIVMVWENQLVGFLVDSVSEVLRIPSNTVESAPPVIAGVGAEYIEGVGKIDDNLLILLNMNFLFSNTQVSQLDMPTIA